MSFCEHCEGQRLIGRRSSVSCGPHKGLQRHSRADEALVMAIKAVRALDIPHVEHVDVPLDEQIVH